MAVGDAYVFPGFLTPVLTQLSFQHYRLLFSHVSEEVRGENTPERKFTSTGSRNHNHQVMSPTSSPLSHTGGCPNPWVTRFECNYNKKDLLSYCTLLNPKCIVFCYVGMLYDSMPRPGGSVVSVSDS